MIDCILTGSFISPTAIDHTGTVRILFGGLIEEEITFIVEPNQINYRINKGNIFINPYSDFTGQVEFKEVHKKLTKVEWRAEMKPKWGIPPRLSVGIIWKMIIHHILTSNTGLGKNV